MANIIDDKDRWVGGNTTLVQTGDIVDRGTDTIALYRLFQRLRGEARVNGGDLYSILGSELCLVLTFCRYWFIETAENSDHEMMNALGDWRYVTKPDIETFGSLEKRQDAISDQGWLGQEWLAKYVASRPGRSSI
jgi:hypothetical protein